MFFDFDCKDTKKFSILNFQLKFVSLQFKPNHIPMKKIFFLVLCCCTVGLFAQAKNEIQIVPKPVSVKPSTGEFTITPTTRIVLEKDNEDMRKSVAVFNERLAVAAGFSLPIVAGRAANNTIHLAINPRLANDEAYKLTVVRNGIRIEAKTPQGTFYAMQTVRQLLPPQIESNEKIANVKWTVPCVEIEDAPSFKYRGLHLDVCRHFFGKEDVMRYIDLLAYHKMNTFHWHLTEDQGWRIEIKKYPRLTTVGAKRDREIIGMKDEGNTNRRWVWQLINHDGFFTQDDVREVLAYAEKRFVTVIPEIEMPGHAVAALAAYPEFSCTGGPFYVEGRWGVLDDIFCTRDTVFQFLEDILTEVIELFPSKYIHIGGDEAPKKRWKRCHACQMKIQKEGLANEYELQSYFIKRIEKFVNSKGRKIIGWDEIFEGGLAPNATVMAWRNESHAVAAAKAGHDVIITPNSHFYLDHYQADPATQPYSIGGFSPIEKVYNYNPVPKELTAAEAKHILGVQGNVWAEYIHTFDHALYMAYPRAAAIAEIGWTPVAQKDFEDFMKRLRRLALRYDAMGINYRKATLTD
jgi:hexosaminidase